MEIKFQNILLRDMVASDIADYVRWFTRDTSWADFDAPWEPVSGDADQERKDWTESYESVQGLPDSALRWKFEIEYGGRHIGWVSAYMLDENFSWISTDEIQEGQKVFRAVGIDICEADAWGKGIGTKALAAFVEYYFAHGVDAIYTQTWSGNLRMIRCAEKLGFVEWNRCPGKREVDGRKYDGLTFRKTR